MRAAVYSMSIVLIAASPVRAAPPAGTYTNEEEVYFDKEAQRTPAPWIGLFVGADGKPAFVDPFGKAAAAIPYQSLASGDAPGRLRMTLTDGRVTTLRRARWATCWGAAPKAAKKPDGSEDWVGASALKLHDQGGRVQFGGGDSGAPPVVLRMRNVIWPSGTNRPSLVLYVHTPDNPDHAVSYAWADPDAKRIGINLRWMQASCTIDPTP